MEDICANFTILENQIRLLSKSLLQCACSRHCLLSEVQINLIYMILNLAYLCLKMISCHNEEFLIASLIMVASVGIEMKTEKIKIKS